MTSAQLFDTETTGKEEPQIIEAASMFLSFGNPPVMIGHVTCARFQPSKEIDLGATAAHGILAEDLVGCDPSAMFELPPCDFLIGQNIDFDWQAAGSPAGPKRIDTCAMARDLWPDLDCYSQAALIYHLDRRNARERLKAAHGAAADILLCKTILDAEIALAKVTSWEELWAFSERSRIPRSMAFGKHRGTAIKDLPKDYVRWLLNATDPPIDPYLRKALTGDTQTTMFMPQ